MGWKMSRYFYETIWNRNNVARQSGTAGKAGYGAYETVTRSTINRHIPHSHPSKHCHFVNQVKFFLNGMWYVYFSRNSSWAYDKSSHPYYRVIHKGFWIKDKTGWFSWFCQMHNQKKKVPWKMEKIQKNPFILPFYSIFGFGKTNEKELNEWYNTTRDTYAWIIDNFKCQCRLLFCSPSFTSTQHISSLLCIWDFLRKILCGGVLSSKTPNFSSSKHFCKIHFSLEGKW